MYDGGSVTYVDGRYWVALTATEATGRYNRSAFIFEIDEVGGVRSEMTVQRPLWQDYPSALYRAYVFKSIHGERVDAPFTLASLTSPSATLQPGRRVARESMPPSMTRPFADC